MYVTTGITGLTVPQSASSKPGNYIVTGKKFLHWRKTYRIINRKRGLVNHNYEPTFKLWFIYLIQTAYLFLIIYSVHMGNQIQDLICIAPLIIVPGDQFNEIVVQHDTSGFIENTGFRETR